MRWFFHCFCLFCVDILSILSLYGQISHEEFDYFVGFLSKIGFGTSFVFFLTYRRYKHSSPFLSLGALLGSLGGVLGCSCWYLGRSWGALGRSWGALGRSAAAANVGVSIIFLFTCMFLKPYGIAEPQGRPYQR